MKEWVGRLIMGSYLNFLLFIFRNTVLGGLILALTVSCVKRPRVGSDAQSIICESGQTLVDGSCKDVESPSPAAVMEAVDGSDPEAEVITDPAVDPEADTSTVTQADQPATQGTAQTEISTTKAPPAGAPPFKSKGGNVDISECVTEAQRVEYQECIGSKKTADMCATQVGCMMRN